MERLSERILYANQWEKRDFSLKNSKSATNAAGLPPFTERRSAGKIEQNPAFQKEKATIAFERKIKMKSLKLTFIL